MQVANICNFQVFFLSHFYHEKSKSTTLLLQENKTATSDVIKQQFLELLHWQWMPDRPYGSGTVPTDQISREGITFSVSQLLAALWNNAHQPVKAETHILLVQKQSLPWHFIAEQHQKVSHDSQGFIFGEIFYCSLLNLIMLYKSALPSAMSPNRSPSRSRERRRSPSSHFHQEQHESEQQHSPPPPKMPLSLWISGDGE